MTDQANSPASAACAHQAAAAASSPEAATATYTGLLLALGPAPFVAAVKGVGRQEREGFFARHRIRAAKAIATSVRAVDKTSERSLRLRAALRERPDEALAEGLLRGFFLAHRPLLAKALDTLGIAHEEGLTNDEGLQRFAAMAPAAKQALAETLAAAAVPGSEFAAVYVDFMQLQMQAVAENG